MEFTNRGYINFNPEYNRKTDKIMTASMSFSNGKTQDGQYKNGYINVMVFSDLIGQLENAVGQLTEVSGYYRENEKDGKKYPQFIITSFDGLGSNRGNNAQSGNNSPFGNSNPVDINDLELPF